MKTLNGINVAVGVTGCIAAYKAAEVVSRLKKLGADVQVVMTKAAKEFVAPLTFGTLSKNKVVCDMFELPDYEKVEHISVASGADVFLVCPATADIIGKVASGIADDFLSTTLMATKAPVIFAAAMNNNMYENPIVQSNIEKLKSFGYHFIEPDDGMLACGTSGKGRLADYDKIIETVELFAYKKKDLLGKKVLVTAGPTVEAIDPVRYITNHSSGKMGYAVAKAARLRGAEVTLVSGPVSLKAFDGVKVISVSSAVEMHDEVVNCAKESDFIIKAAAVADYRPKDVKENKIKKGGDMQIELSQNPDILKSIAASKGETVVAGFCMETENLLENAMKKLESKNLDLIVANDLSKEGAGFKTNTNIVTILDKNGGNNSLDIMEKEELAHVILDKCIEMKKVGGTAK